MVDSNDIQRHADGIITRAKNILTAPEPTWEVVAKETDEPKKVFLGYAMPLIAIGPIASFIATTLFSLGFGLVFGLIAGIVGFLLGLAGIWIVALLANALSPGFDGKNDFPAAFRLVAYSMTAAWVAGIFNLIPFIGWLLAWIGALYSFYLLYKGASPVMGVPQEKSALYTIVLVLIWFVISIVIAFIATALATTLALAGALSAV